MTTTTQARSTAPGGAILLVSVAGLVVTFGLILMSLYSQGHASFNTTSDGVVWGLPVATYVFFVLTSTGLTFVASLAMVFGFKEFYPIAKRCIWLAVATLIAGFVALALELGHPFRMLWAIPLSFQIRSPMNWMGVFYAAYLVLLLFKFQKINAGDWDSGASRRLGIASFIAVVIAHGTLGSVFGMMAMRPFWYGPMIPLYFLLTAALSGVAFATLITYAAYGGQAAMPEKVRSVMTGAMPKLFAAVLGVVLVATISRVATGLWSNAEGLQVWQYIVKTPWFWIESVALVGAFLIFLSPRLRSDGTMQLGAALLVILALFIGRYEFVIGGQLVPLFKGSWAPVILQYTPSFTEWMALLLAVFVTAAIVGIGERFLRLGARPEVIP